MQASIELETLRSRVRCVNLTIFFYSKYIFNFRFACTYKVKLSSKKKVFTVQSNIFKRVSTSANTLEKIRKKKEILITYYINTVLLFALLRLT